jgi:hypothetical protein
MISKNISTAENFGIIHLDFYLLNPPSTFAPGGQKPFREKVSGLPKAFHWDGLDTLFFFVSLCVPLWLKLDGGFRISQRVEIFHDLCYSITGVGQTEGFRLIMVKHESDNR